MQKPIAIWLMCFGLFFSLTGCGSTYHADDFIGKTSFQIETEYGFFDCVGMPHSEDGLYRNTFCGYTLQEPQRGYLGTSPERLFFISFDENGVAYKTYESYRPGG